MASAATLALLTASCSDSINGGTSLIDADDSALPSADDSAEVTSSETADDAGLPSTSEPEESAALNVWADSSYTLAPIATVAQPIGLTHRPGSDDLWIIERAGRVSVINRTIDADAATETISGPEPVLDISAQVTTEGEGGLLGITFDPEGEHLYLHYTDREGANIIAAFAMADGSNQPGEEQILLRVPEPYSNHNGGDIAFSPTDGHLYISLGDGGAGGDPEGNGQDASTLLGSILRIDPTPGADAPYAIPSDNPFVNDEASADEIWLWGLRNPWRMSFDPTTGDLWIGDVGQELVEEVNVVAPDRGGANLGWNLMEGNDSYGGEAPADHLAPFYTYDHNQGRCSITGGYVYRGAAIPALDGVYLFADFCAPGIAGVVYTDGAAEAAELSLDRDPENVMSFGRGPDGELYVMEAAGQISRIQNEEWPWTTVVES